MSFGCVCTHPSFKIWTSGPRFASALDRWNCHVLIEEKISWSYEPLCGVIGTEVICDSSMQSWLLAYGLRAVGWPREEGSFQCQLSALLPPHNSSCHEGITDEDLMLINSTVCKYQVICIASWVPEFSFITIRSCLWCNYLPSEHPRRVSQDTRVTWLELSFTLTGMCTDWLDLVCCNSFHGNQTVIVEEVDSFLFRPHVGSRARYYAVSIPFCDTLACVLRKTFAVRSLVD